MNKIFILLAILAVASCNPIFVLDTITNAYTTGTTFTQVYQKPSWNTVTDFAVYGWMKIDSSYPRAEYSTIFQLCQNTDANFKGWTAVGDQTLSMYVKDTSIHSPTYTRTGTPSNLRLTYPFKAQDMNQWAFFYMAHGQNVKRTAVYVQFQNTVIQYVMNGVDHIPSSYYKLYVGQSYVWKYFQGTIAKVFIDGGDSAYRENGYNALQTIRPDAPNQPAVIPSCITIYDQCYYQGNTISICTSIPSFDLKKVKSIYVPKGASFTLYGGAQYTGQTIKFTESKPCIDILEGWSFVQMASGVKTRKVTHAKYLRNQHSKKLVY